MVLNSQELLRQLLIDIGEDPDREGLEGTPLRVIKSWSEIYAGYTINVASLFTVFKDVHGYSQIVICKNIEMFSMCEHHMLPFFGKAHVAYLPDKKVIGISKLARILEVFSRRLQIQERIGEQVTDALMENLQPKGAACIIEAVHMCMRMRGVNKQESKMVTSSLKGEFLTDGSLRLELFNLLNLNK